MALPLVLMTHSIKSGENESYMLKFKKCVAQFL